MNKRTSVFARILAAQALGATDAQLDFPIVYASGREGWAVRDLKDEHQDLGPVVGTQSYSVFGGGHHDQGAIAGCIHRPACRVDRHAVAHHSPGKHHVRCFVQWRAPSLQR